MLFEETGHSFFSVQGKSELDTTESELHKPGRVGKALDLADILEQLQKATEESVAMRPGIFRGWKWAKAKADRALGKTGN